MPMSFCLQQWIEKNGVDCFLLSGPIPLGESGLPLRGPVYATRGSRDREKIACYNFPHIHIVTLIRACSFTKISNASFEVALQKFEVLCSLVRVFEAHVHAEISFWLLKFPKF